MYPQVSMPVKTYE